MQARYGFIRSLPLMCLLAVTSGCSTDKRIGADTPNPRSGSASLSVPIDGVSGHPAFNVTIDGTVQLSQSSCYRTWWMKQACTIELSPGQHVFDYTPTTPPDQDCVAAAFTPLAGGIVGAVGCQVNNKQYQKNRDIFHSGHCVMTVQPGREYTLGVGGNVCP
jgi:hypothetical protein